jgi:N4-gp56 family major capsid protein
MAGPTRSSSYVNYSSTGTSKFIPQIWSGKIVEKFYKASVFGEISNTDYEGEVSSMGDKVIIRTVPDITVSDYQVGQTLSNQTPEKANVELNIDQAKYFSVIVDDVDKAQADIDLMDKFSTDASEQMKIQIDSNVLTYIGGNVAAANAGASAGAISGDLGLGTATSPLTLTKSNILDSILDLGQVLDEQNVPETSRWIVLPAWAVAMVKKSDLKDASLAGDATSIMRNGRVGQIDRFTVYLSNNLNKVTGTNAHTQVLAGHNSGLTFASQITNVETLKSESKFGTIVRGLNVFGRSVIKPESVALLRATA